MRIFALVLLASSMTCLISVFCSGPTDEFIVSNVIFNSFNVLLNVVIVVVSSAFNFSSFVMSWVKK